MPTNSWLLEQLRPVWKFLSTYYETYPQITEKDSLCAYYRKHNKAAPYPLTLIVVNQLITQTIRLFTLLIGREPWEYWKQAIVTWSVLNFGFISCLFFSIRTVSKVSDEEHKRSLSYQMSVRSRLWLIALFMTVVLGTSPLFLPRTNSPMEIVAIMWIAFSLYEAQICVWFVDGFVCKVVLLIAFNCVFCFISIHCGFFVGKWAPKLYIPVISSFAFLLSFDRQGKENFVLKWTLKRQKTMYEQHLEKVRDPVIILSKTNILFLNEASRTKIASNLASFWHKTGFMVTENGDSLKEAINVRLNSTTENTEVVQRKYYMHDVSSDIISYNRVLSVTLIESTFLHSEKLVSLAFHDMTEELNHEQVRVEEKYKHMLLFSLSHELRTPINIFQAFLSTSKHSMATEAEKEMHKNAKGSWWYLRNKIGDILDYAQLLSDEFAFHKIHFSLRYFVKHLHKITYCFMADRRRSVRLDFYVDDLVKDEFVGDRDRLEQVLFNLLSNAVKFTSTGTISLRVYYTRINTRSITFEVTDTGSGMAPHYLLSLFALRSNNSHATVEASRREHQAKSKGLSGLGLTVSKMLCNRMGADIKVRSELGKGSTFSFSLMGEPEEEAISVSQSLGDSRGPPKADVAEEEKASNNSPGSDEGHAADQGCKRGSPSSAPLALACDLGKPPKPFVRQRTRAGGKTSILVVDDNALNRCVVKEMVAKMGFLVSEAENGKKAVEKLGELIPDIRGGTIVVFMDIDMPIMDGIEATAEIRRTQKGAQLQIIALTAFASEEERKRCMDVGMNGFISKPLTKESLIDLFTNLKLMN